jgi:hypothetical protein
MIQSCTPIPREESVSNFIQNETYDAEVYRNAEKEEKRTAQILSAKRSLTTNLSCVSIFIVGHIIIVLLPKSIRSYFSVIVFTFVKGAMPILTTIANFGTVQFIIAQYCNYLKNFKYFCKKE